MYKVENDQLKKIESWTTTYTASEDCLVSFYTDGYENSVNSSTYSTLTPSDVRAVIRGAAPEQSTVSRGSDPIFRTVMEEEWYALFICQDRDWNPVVGETYQMQLTGFDDYIIPAQVVFLHKNRKRFAAPHACRPECGARAEYSHMRRNRGRIH